MDLERALNHVEATTDRRLADLVDLLRIPSVSTLPAHKADVRRAAEWVRARLERAGVGATAFETAGHPIVYGERLDRPGKPTVLVYGHYDVQPPDPLDLWKRGPFDPWVNEKGDLVARGSTDDKGQMLTWIHAAEAWIQGAGGLPVNVKFLIEGEEEIGSSHLDGWIKENRERLKADCVAISDSDQFAEGLPALTYGLRGLAYMHLRVTGPDKDLHSGMFGGSLTNPINALATIIAGLRDPRTGRVLVDGFYDRVRPLSAAERLRIGEAVFRAAGLFVVFTGNQPADRTGPDAEHAGDERATCDWFLKHRALLAAWLRAIERCPRRDTIEVPVVLQTKPASRQFPRQKSVPETESAKSDENSRSVSPEGAIAQRAGYSRNTSRKSSGRMAARISFSSTGTLSRIRQRCRSSPAAGAATEPPKCSPATDTVG
ncbi:MAG: M20/M25/M40 family metallo-hydrolase [Planctomycetia bacterium]|nr:M20/M25/M40 family metallo-hydrolase [Planctomycetia bacterium]